MRKITPALLSTLLFKDYSCVILLCMCRPAGVCSRRPGSRLELGVGHRHPWHLLSGNLRWLLRERPRPQNSMYNTSYVIYIAIYIEKQLTHDVYFFVKQTIKNNNNEEMRLDACCS